MPMSSHPTSDLRGTNHRQDPRIRVRGLRRAGLWAAARLGLSGVDAEIYARTLITADAEWGGDDGVIGKLRDDLAGKHLGDSDIRDRLAHFLAEAAEDSRY